MKVQDISEYFKENYSGLGEIKNVKPLEHTNINSINLYINSSKGNYVLRKFIDGSPPIKIEKMCQIINFCNKNKIKVSKSIKNKKNKYVDPKKKIYITNYYNGSLFHGTNKELIDLAINLALLHRTLKSNKITYNYRTNSAYYKPLTIKEIERLKNKIKPKSRFDKLILKELKHISKYSNKYEIELKKLRQLNFKKQLIHHDLHPGNVIFKKNKVVTILDFLAMRKGVIVEDVSFSSVRFASQYLSSVDKIQNKIDLFLKTYLKYNDVEDLQLDNMKYFFLQKILGRIGYILRKKYFFGSNIWLIDFEKNLNLLKLLNKINFN